LAHASVAKRPSSRTFAWVLAVASCLFGTTGCSDLPPSLPSTAARVRFASRVDLVELAIADRARAEKVRRLYAEIDTLMITVMRASSSSIVKLGSEEGALTDAETRAAVAKVRDADIAAFKRYIQLQMELRRSLNAKEFAKLDAIN